MKLQPYITFKDGENLLICQRDAPHYLGLISGKKESDFHTVQIPLHNLFISFKGVLEGNFLLMRDKEVEHIELIFNEMAMFYFENRIMKFPERFKKHHV